MSRASPRPQSKEVYDIPRGLGGSHTVSIVEDLPSGRVQLRIWYGSGNAARLGDLARLGRRHN